MALWARAHTNQSQRAGALACINPSGPSAIDWPSMQRIYKAALSCPTIKRSRAEADIAGRIMIQGSLAVSLLIAGLVDNLETPVAGRVEPLFKSSFGG